MLSFPAGIPVRKVNFAENKQDGFSEKLRSPTLGTPNFVELTPIRRWFKGWRVTVLPHTAGKSSSVPKGPPVFVKHIPQRVYRVAIPPEKLDIPPD